MTYCNNCGSELLQDAKFCNNCGAKTEEIPAPIVNQEQESYGHPIPPEPRIAPAESQPAPQPAPPAPPAPQTEQPVSPAPEPQPTPPVPPAPQPAPPVPPAPQPAPPVPPAPQPAPQPAPPVPPAPQQVSQKQAPPVLRQAPPIKAGGGVATMQKNNKPILFIGIGVAGLVIIVLAIVLIVNIFSGGSSDDPNIGVWTAQELTMMGMTMSPEDIYPDGISLELKSGNKCTLTLDGGDHDVNYEIDGNTFTLEQYGDEFPGTINGNVIIITNLLNMGLDITFVKGDWDGEGSDATQSNGAGNLMGGNDDGDISSDFVAPGYGTEQTMPVETLSDPSDWYGIVTISDYTGNDDISGEYEAWGYIGTDEIGTYFELYANGPSGSDYASDLMSFNIELHDYSFFPVVDEHAWLYGDATLKEEDNTWYVPSITNGVLGATYNYDYNGESFVIDFALAQISDGSTSSETAGTDSGEADTDSEAPAPAPEPEPAPGPVTPSLTVDELREIYYAVTELEIDEKYSLTYDEILSRYFNGVTGNITNQGETFISYQWISVEAETSLLNMSFDINEDGSVTYKSMSINNISF